MSVTTGASFGPVTVKLAASSSYSVSGSVALNVIVSEPVQSALGAVMMATRLASILTVNSMLPLAVQVISASVLSRSET